MTDLKTTILNVRIAGLPVQIERQSDGTQRQEWLTDEGGEPYGTVFKARWNDRVLAIRTSGEEKTFAVFKYGRSTQQAFTEARLWVISREQPVRFIVEPRAEREHLFDVVDTLHGYAVKSFFTEAKAQAAADLRNA